MAVSGTKKGVGVKIAQHRSAHRREKWMTRRHPGKNGRLETRTVAAQAATTELLVAGLAQWVRFV